MWDFQETDLRHRFIIAAMMGMTGLIAGAWQSGDRARRAAIGGVGGSIIGFLGFFTTLTSVISVLVLAALLILVSGGLERLRILETNYGRTAGWYIECEGRRIATLTYVGWAEMFWDSYSLESLTTEPADLRLLESESGWRDFVYRNQRFNRSAPHAFPAMGGPPPGEPRRVLMRGLYLDVLYAPVLDDFLLWIRRWWKRT